MQNLDCFTQAKVRFEVSLLDNFSSSRSWVLGCLLVRCSTCKSVLAPAGSSTLRPINFDEEFARLLQRCSFLILLQLQSATVYLKDKESQHSTAWHSMDKAARNVLIFLPPRVLLPQKRRSAVCGAKPTGSTEVVFQPFTEVRLSSYIVLGNAGPVTLYFPL